MASKRSAVTLIEVLLVIMISAAAIGVAGIGTSFHENATIRSESREVLDTLRIARETAISTRCLVTVRCDRATHPSNGVVCNRLQLTGSPSPYSDSVMRFGPQARIANDLMADPIWLNEKIQIRADRREVTFGADGRADRDASWIVQTDGESLEIMITADEGHLLVRGP